MSGSTSRTISSRSTRLSASTACLKISTGSSTDPSMAVDQRPISCEHTSHQMSVSTRSYRMKARAAAAEEATERILDATEQLFWEDPAQPVTLAAVARLAGVSVHSIIRRFGGQEGVMRAATERAAARTEAERAEPDPGDLAAAVAVLVGHYERTGDRVMRMLAAEYALPAIT